MKDSFGARSTLAVGDENFDIFRLDAVTEGHVGRLQPEQAVGHPDEKDFELLDAALKNMAVAPL